MGQTSHPLYFVVAEMESWRWDPLSSSTDPLKDLKEQGVRSFHPAPFDAGSHVERGAVVMPGYVNIGAFVGAGTMVDTWATVGSCANW